jgi:hypothetical protein
MAGDAQALRPSSSQDSQFKPKTRHTMSKTMLAATMLAAMSASLALATGSADARDVPTCGPTSYLGCGILKSNKKVRVIPAMQRASAGGGLTTDATSGTRRGVPKPPACHPGVCSGVGGMKMKSPRPKI